MWCYHKPGFQALLLAELQRQQQCSQFCDTLLKTEGVSVPAHSCILSAISPHISSTLSATPPPPAGQSRLLDFRALGACTLLHMARLLYCGEMAGEGEKEKQEAISAAAKLGIHGLVEVTKKDRRSGNEVGWHTEVGVQTEPLVPEANEGRPCRCRRDATDTSALLWKETLLDGLKDTWTQTEEPPVKAGPPSLPVALFETIDVTAFHSLGQTDSHCVPLQIPYMPISLTCPPGENQTHQPSFPLVNSMQESTAACTLVSPPLLPFSSPATPCAADLRSWRAGPQGAARDVTAAEEWEGKQLEQFQGNIPGYISYFLKPTKEGGSGRGRARRRRGTGGARRAGTAERRARRPQARTPGRGRGGLTQTVDVQDVGVSRLQKLFLQRLGPSRTGQGGGAVGRKLYLKTRELLKSAKSCQRGRGHRKMLEFSLGGAVPPCSEGGKGNMQHGRRSSTQQFNQDRLHGGVAQTARAKPTTSVSFASPHMKFCNVQTFSAFTPSCQPSPSLLPAASSLLHSASPPPPHEVQPEHLDRLLEEVMMDLAILPNNNNNSTPHSQPPLPTSSSSCAYASCGNALAENKQSGPTAGLLEANPCLLGSTQVVAIARESGSSNNDMPVLQQQGEAELNEMLDHFLQSFEQHVDSCTAREEVEMGGQSCTEVSQPYTVLGKYRKKRTQTSRTPHMPNTNAARPARRSRATQLQMSEAAETAPRRPRPLSASARSAAPPKHAEGRPAAKVTAPARKSKKRGKKEILLSLEKKQVRVKNPVQTSGDKAQVIHNRREKQLQQMPVVKLKRSGQLPAAVTLQKCSCLEVKSPKAKSGSSSVKRQSDWCSTKRYPIRSRLREAQVDCLPFLEKPLEIQQPPKKKRVRGRPRKKRQLPSLSNGTSSIPPIQPVEPCGTDEQREKNLRGQEEELTVQPQEVAEGPAMRGQKRAAESEEVTSDESALTKRVCFEQTAAPMSETSAPSSRSADFLSEPATREIEDIPLTSVRDRLQRSDREEKTMWIEIKLRETEEGLMDEEMESRRDGIDSEGDHWQGSTATRSLPSHSAKDISPGPTGSLDEDKDEDVDVIGGSTPVPEPVMISWTESSEGEEEGDEDIDVVGEKTDCTPPVVFATVSNQTEVILH